MRTIDAEIVAALKEQIHAALAAAGHTKKDIFHHPG